MKIDRMFKILYILLEKKQVTASELADKFEVSTRTIYRDIDALSMAGFPIYTNKGRSGGINLLDNFVMDKALLSSEEQNNMIMGLETLSAIQYENVDHAISKLKSIFNKSADNWIEVDFSHWASSEDEKEKFELLKFALTNFRAIKFDYYDSHGNKSAREVQPIKLLFKHKSWYLRVYCLSKEDIRTFKVNRIKNLIITSDVFDRKLYDDFELKPADYDKSHMIDLMLKFTSRVKHRIFDEFDEKTITVNEDGSFTISMKTLEDDWLYNYIISFANEVDIIEPLYIKDIVLEILESTIRHYKKI